MCRRCVRQRPEGPFAMCHSPLSSYFLSSLSCPINKAIKRPSIHPSIFFRLSGAGSQGQLPEQGHPDFPLPGHFLQLFREDPKAFPGQLSDIVTPACPGYSLGSPPSGTCQEHLPREAKKIIWKTKHTLYESDTCMTGWKLVNDTDSSCLKRCFCLGWLGHDRVFLDPLREPKTIRKIISCFVFFVFFPQELYVLLACW